MATEPTHPPRWRMPNATLTTSPWLFQGPQSTCAKCTNEARRRAGSMHRRHSHTPCTHSERESCESPQTMSHLPGGGGHQWSGCNICIGLWPPRLLPTTHQGSTGSGVHPGQRSLLYWGCYPAGPTLGPPRSGGGVVLRSGVGRG